MNHLMHAPHWLQVQGNKKFLKKLYFFAKFDIKIVGHQCLSVDQGVKKFQIRVKVAQLLL